MVNNVNSEVTFWQEIGPMPGVMPGKGFPGITPGITYDLVVIGGGIIGVSAAIEYKEQHPSHSVVVVERSIPPRGATMRNAGFACIGSLSEIAHDIDLMGAERARDLVKRRWDGLQKLRSRCGDDAIGLEEHGGHEIFTHHHPALDRLDEVNHLLFPVFEHPMFERADHLCDSLGFANVQALVRTAFEGTIHSGLLVQRLWQIAQDHGIAFEMAQARDVKPTGASVEVSTSNGCIQAQHVLIATNAFPLGPSTDITPGRGQIVVTSPVRGLPLRGSFHMNEGYVYFRNVGDRVLLGGGRNLAFAEEETTEFGTTTIIQQYLEDLLRTTILPGIEFAIDYRWSGIMGFRPDKQPFVGSVLPNVYRVFACNGMGVALGSTVAAEAVELISATSRCL